ncbi:MAG: hypothetical protein ACRC4M_05305 [Mycoplasma sp.]
MGFIKTIFKSAFGIAGVACMAAGIGISIAPAIMVPNSKEETVTYTALTNPEFSVNLGTGVNDWLVWYEDDGSISPDSNLELDRENLLASLGATTKSDALKRLRGYYENKDPRFSLYNIDISAIKSMQSNDALNGWGITLAVFGPLIFVIGIPLTYLAFKKKK